MKVNDIGSQEMDADVEKRFAKQPDWNKLGPEMAAMLKEYRDSLQSAAAQKQVALSMAKPKKANGIEDEVLISGWVRKVEYINDLLSRVEGG